MIKIFQKRWFDIEFSEFTHLDANKLADNQFYKKFYQHFYACYPNYETLPSNYVKAKKQIAVHLAQLIRLKKAQSILSVGCGNGLIEKELYQLLPHLELSVYEQDANNLKWLKDLTGIKLYFGETLDCLPSSKKYDFIYLSSVDYALTNEQYTQLLLSLKQISNSSIILTNIILPYPTFLKFFTYWIKYTLFKIRLYHPGQLWGYLRHIHEHKAIFNDCGFEIKNIGKAFQNLSWIEISPTNY